MSAIGAGNVNTTWKCGTGNSSASSRPGKTSVGSPK
jgi:hypothetical protein